FQDSVEDFDDVGSAVADFTATVTAAAHASIPRSSTKASRLPVPWWNEECKRAVQERKQALHRLSCNPILLNLISYKQAKARARRVICLAKKTSWEAYVSSITRRTPA